MGIGLLRGGLLGSLASFLGFTLPSVLLLTLFAYFYSHLEIDMGWIQGLKLVAVAIVAQAIWDMSKKLIPSVVHLIIAILALLTLQFWGNPFAQVTVIALAAVIGARLFKQTNGVDDTAQKNLPISKTTGGLLLALFAMLMIALPIANSFVKEDLLTIIEKCYLAGALVFGGGTM